MRSPEPFVKQLLLPFSGGADQAVGHGTKPEVDDEAPIRLKGPVARQVERWSQQEVGDIAKNDGEESLKEIHQHNKIRRQFGAGRVLIFSKGTLDDVGPANIPS